MTGKAFYEGPARGTVLLRTDLLPVNLFVWPLFSSDSAPYLLFDLIQQLPPNLRGHGTGDVNALSTVCCDAAGDELIVISYRKWDLVAAFKREPPHAHQWAFGGGPRSDFQMAVPIAVADGGMFHVQHHAHLLPNAPIDGRALGSGGLEARGGSCRAVSWYRGTRIAFLNQTKRKNCRNNASRRACSGCCCTTTAARCRASATFRAAWSSSSTRGSRPR